MSKADKLRLATVEAEQKQRREKEVAEEKERKRVQRFRAEMARNFAKFVADTVDARTTEAAAAGKTRFEYSSHNCPNILICWDFAKQPSIKKLVKQLEKDGFKVETHQSRSQPSTDPDWMGRVDESLWLRVTW